MKLVVLHVLFPSLLLINFFFQKKSFKDIIGVSISSDPDQTRPSGRNRLLTDQQMTKMPPAGKMWFGCMLLFEEASSLNGIGADSTIKTIETLRMTSTCQRKQIFS